MTLLKRDSIMDILLLNVLTFLGGKLFHKIALVTCKGVYLFSEPNQIVIDLIGLRRANPRNGNIRRKLF